MSSVGQDPFGQLLRPDPTVALPNIDIAVSQKSGPLHKVQYVIEFVGPRSIPAPAAIHLLAPEWYRALGQPTIFAMRPADLQWQYLNNSPDGSYDSLALAWDLIDARGTLSESAATHLFQAADRFAPFIQRRALPLPPPQDVDRSVRALVEVREALDIGFALNVLAPGAGYLERELWIECAKLGLSFGSVGSFDWRVPDSPLPLLSVTPFGTNDTFSLAQVNADTWHSGVTIGFSFPLCPSPAQALQGAFYLADQIVKDLGGQAYDQDDQPVQPSTKESLRDNLREALSLFSQAGMITGSAEAVKLFDRD